MNEKTANLTLKNNLTLNKSGTAGTAFQTKSDAYMNVARPAQAKAGAKAGNMDMAALVGYLSKMKTTKK